MGVTLVTQPSLPIAQIVSPYRISDGSAVALFGMTSQSVEGPHTKIRSVLP